jgi:hypothetical protein
MTLAQSELKSYLKYSRDTGKFIWLMNRGSNKVMGREAGSIMPIGYRIIVIKHKPYRAHRLAWLYVEGFFPNNIGIDHINGIRDDNRWLNLRLAGQQCNIRNAKVFKTNTSGISGVNKFSEKWRSRITVDGKDIHLGYFKSKLDAVRARWEAEKKYDFPNCQTTSTALKYLKQNALCLLKTWTNL